MGESSTPTGPFELAGYRVDPAILRVTGQGRESRLESKAMQVLVYLVERVGRVVSRAELEEHIWSGRVVTEDAVTNTILKLRRAFGDDARHPRVIETIPKTGYRLIAAVTPVDDVDEAGAAEPALVPTPRTWARARVPIATALAGLLVVIGGWMYLERATSPGDRLAPGVEKPAVAVLPFENLGASPEQDYFANGITADLITDLSRLSGLLVIAPGSVFAYRDSGAGLGQVSAELGVDYVVVGSVQRSGERLRINVQLIEAEDERALWGERYEGTAEDVFDMQDALTRSVITALEIELPPEARQVLARRPTTSVVAYDHYLRGLEEHGRRSSEQNLAARAHFEQAIQLDPMFARAYAGLALTHSRDAIDGWTPTPSRSIEQAAEWADRAAAMDPSLPQVHFVSGQVDLFRRRHREAVEATQRAIRVDPNYADAYALSAWILSYAGRPKDALAAMETAMRLNPRPTGSYLEVLGEIRFVQGRYAESADIFRQVLDINPAYTRARMWRAAALALAGELDQAEWEADELRVLSPDFSLARLEFAFPFRDPRMLQRLLDGLREAGLLDPGSP